MKQAMPIVKHRDPPKADGGLHTYKPGQVMSLKKINNYT
jgi:hypothetical protein